VAINDLKRHLLILIGHFTLKSYETKNNTGNEEAFLLSQVYTLNYDKTSKQ